MFGSFRIALYYVNWKKLEKITQRVVLLCKLGTPQPQACQAAILLPLHPYPLHDNSINTYYFIYIYYYNIIYLLYYYYSYHTCLLMTLLLCLVFAWLAYLNKLLLMKRLCDWSLSEWKGSGTQGMLMLFAFEN